MSRQGRACARPNFYPCTDARVGQKTAWPAIPCHDDMFHIQHEFEALVNIWTRIASGVRSKSEAFEARLVNPPRRCEDSLLLNELADLGQTEARSSLRAGDLRTFARWLERDVSSLAGLDRASCQELFDFVVDELNSAKMKIRRASARYAAPCKTSAMTCSLSSTY